MRLKSPTIVFACSLLVYSVTAYADCTLSAESLSFGQYDVLDAQPLEGVGTVIVSCTAATSYTVTLSAGNGSFTERHLNGGEATLIYNLYTDAAYSQVWGDGGGVSAAVSGSADGTINHDVYGRVPPRQNVTAGYYSDVITVTVEF